MLRKKLFPPTPNRPPGRMSPFFLQSMSLLFVDLSLSTSKSLCHLFPSEVTTQGLLLNERSSVQLWSGSSHITSTLSPISMSSGTRLLRLATKRPAPQHDAYGNLLFYRLHSTHHHFSLHPVDLSR